MDNIELAVFSGRLNAICEEMGVVLQKAALSPNIKDRLDFSCAFFDSRGHICAQAAHIPVHLGSMAYAMSGLVSRFEWREGDVLVLNDPFLGGTHLPDVTMVSPLFYLGLLVGFVANRAHHANIGSASPGSMPVSSNIAEEGVLINPAKLYSLGKRVESTASLLCKINGEESIPGDFLAQVSANKVGILRLTEWLSSLEMGGESLADGIQALNRYGEEIAISQYRKLPNGTATFIDYLDDDGFGGTDIPIAIEMKIDDGRISVDFTGSSDQVKGNLNCPISVSAAAVYYVFICLLPDYVPHCHGVFSSIEITAPQGSIVNADSGAAVAAGNVETSMRIVDVVLGALAKLGVELPAASQGTMNNIALGGRGDKAWDYYETVGGGAGASSKYDGLSAVQCHLTNTLNTPIESLEMHYPLRIEEYAVRSGSGGRGLHSGGDGLVRSYRFNEPTSVTLLTERRKHRAWGLNNGGSGASGINLLNGETLPPKASVLAQKNDLLVLKTPGGGGSGGQ